MKAVTDDSFVKDVLGAEKPVVVDFWAPWCRPCTKMKPHLEALSLERTDVEFVCVDIDVNDKTAASLGVMSIPTLFLYQNGEVKDRIVGNMDKSKIEEWLSANMS